MSKIRRRNVQSVQDVSPIRDRDQTPRTLSAPAVGLRRVLFQARTFEMEQLATHVLDAATIVVPNGLEDEVFIVHEMRDPLGLAEWLFSSGTCGVIAKEDVGLQEASSTSEIH